MNPDTQSHAASGDVEVPIAGHAYDGIEELDNPLPRWWLWTFAVTVVFAIFYWMWLHSLPNGKLSFDAYAEAQTAYDLEALANAIDPATIETMAADPALVGRGKTIFDNRCSTCHGALAEGATGPNLTDTSWIHGGDLRSIYITVAGGYPKLGMPEWRNVLEEAQLAEVVAYLVTVRGTNRVGKPPQGEVYTGDLVIKTGAPPSSPVKAPARMAEPGLRTTQ